MKSKKICVACNKDKYGLKFSKEEDKPDWITNANRANLVPIENMPNMENVHKVEINIPELRNKFIYYWATESKLMKKTQGTLKMCNNNNCTPEYAYGNYCNSGVTKLNKSGKTTIYVETPISYYTEGESYEPHIHFSVYNEKSGKWINEMYTLDIE
tara:strand:+ start:631 stop:1098 length:468 start_codon:yes stop_codon:yes gene_type:complete